MANEHPTLVFLCGPDGGRRIILDRLPVKIGRSSDCGIRVADAHASREQAEFGANPEGVVVVNLSGRGTEIAGKVYKHTRPILLATGDIIKIGLDTEILFVSAGDDATDVLADLQAERLAEAEKRRAAELAQDRQQRQREEGKKKKNTPELEAPVEPAPGPAPAVTAMQERSDSEKIADAAAAARKKRKRKIAIGLGIYLGVIAIVAVLLSLQTDKGRADERPRRLTQQEIEGYLEEPESGFVNSQRAAIALETARDKYDRQHVAERNLWDSVAAYKKYLVYSGRSEFESEKDARQYDSALAELKKNIWAHYEEGSRALQQERWDAARKNFKAIIDMVPDPTNRVNTNATAQSNYCLKKQKSKQPKGPF